MQIDFNKSNGLVPVIIQNNTTLQVIMLGYMNEAAFNQTIEEKRVTFFSRSKNRLWTKGETSGHFLELVDYKIDCDNDTILIKVNPTGPSCHTGAKTCFDEDVPKGFLYELEQIIGKRIDDDDPDSYTNQLFKRGINKIAQKVGEEAVEVVIEAKDSNDDLFKNEVADLLYHTLILLKAKKTSLTDIEYLLKKRNIINN